MKKLFTLIALFLFGFTLLGQANKQLNKLFNQIEGIEKTYAITNPIWDGLHPDTYVFQKVDNQIKQANELKAKLESLIAIPDNELTDQGRINKQIRILQLRNSISQTQFKTYLIPFNAEGGFFNSPSFFLPNLPFKTKQDYDNYLRWLPSFATFIFYNQELMAKGIAEKIQAPKVIAKNAVDLLESWTQSDITLHPFYSPIKSIPADISQADRESIEKNAQRIISETILPSYKKLKKFIEQEYLPAAPRKVGISEINKGKAYYENRVKHFTTLDITPDSVYATGLAEVARIRNQMEQIIKDVKFEGSFTEFLQFLRSDPQFYPKSGQELLNRAAWLSKKAEGQLPRLFSKLYSLPFTVEPVPDAIAPKYTGGRYVGGSRSKNKPGIYWVNTYNLSSRTLYTLPALSLHEAVPGHHLQISLASELEGLPEFRDGYYISAFGEGWGLYSEYLGEEMGMYETPYELFGRYTYEMWRACRLVVDVGLHYKGWTRQQAIDYMASNTALSLHEVNTEIDRYIGWPGQAVSYKMGELTILALRKRAVEALGATFDIQQFHDVILRNGAVPLPILEAEVDKYISSEKSK
ncbi:DUF885 domain-containing protein [Ekhidna sp. To15]|uniref:DUF885 domain-containing protein n=1 Tax=Ekhidna sp. To15 TaxID=3395267 RepID=UPI003F51D8B2